MDYHLASAVFSCLVRKRTELISFLRFPFKKLTSNSQIFRRAFQGVSDRPKGWIDGNPSTS